MPPAVTSGAGALSRTGRQGLATAAAVALADAAAPAAGRVHHQPGRSDREVVLALLAALALQLDNRNAKPDVRG